MSGVKEVQDRMPNGSDGAIASSDMTISEGKDVEQGKADMGNVGVKELVDDPFKVVFSQGDPEDPKNWSKRVKWGVTMAMSAMGFNRIMVSTIMAPAIPTLGVEFNMSATESAMAMSVYLLATAFGPLVIGPLAEIYGRKPVIHVTNIWFLIWNLICGFANSKGLLIASRLLAGFGASAVYVVAYAVLADVWPPEQRGHSLSLYILIPLLGAAVGPIVGGFIVQYTTWRWMFWSTAIMQGALELVSIPIVRETYAPLLLRRRAEKLRTETGDSRYHAAIETIESGQSAVWKLRMSLTRPLRLLAFHPIIQIQAIVSGLEYGLLYFALSSLSTLFVSAYGESTSISGLHYLALFLGEIIGSQIYGPVIDYAYRVLTVRAGGNASPELRIPLLLPSVLITPAGLLLYGWSAQHRLFWFVVDVGVAIMALGMQLFGMTMRAYIIDSYPEHVSSASAATQLLSSLTAFAFPLFAEKMYAALGYGWGNSLLAFASMGIALPATGVLWRYGAKLRAKKQSSY